MRGKNNRLRINEGTYEIKLALPSEEYVLTGNFASPDSYFANNCLSEVTFANEPIIVSASRGDNYVSELITGYKIPVGLIKRKLNTIIYGEENLKLVEKSPRRCFFIDQASNLMPYFALLERVRYSGGANFLSEDDRKNGLLKGEGFKMADELERYSYRYLDAHDDPNAYYEELDERFYGYKKRLDELLEKREQGRTICLSKKA